MKPGNRASGAVGFTALRIARQHQRRPAVTLNHAGCNNSDHATMPAFAIEHQAIRRALRGIAIETLLYLFHDARLFVLPLGVKLVELGGNFLGLGRLASSE